MDNRVISLASSEGKRELRRIWIISGGFDSGTLTGTVDGEATQNGFVIQAKWRGELRALIQVDQHLVLRLASPHRHEQGLQHDVRGLSALHRPAYDPARIEIDDDGKVSETLAGSDIGDGSCMRPIRTVARLLVEPRASKRMQCWEGTTGHEPIFMNDLSAFPNVYDSILLLLKKRQYVLSVGVGYL